MKLPILALLLLAAPAVSQQDNPGLPVVELNQLEPAREACALTFVLKNPGPDLEELDVELAVFDTDGRVERLTRLSLGALSTDSTRVRRFMLPDLDCTQVSRLLINEVKGAEALTLRNKTEMEFGQ